MGTVSLRLAGLLGLALALGLGLGCKRKAVEGDSQAEAKHLFDSICARCHGKDGRGGFPAAEGQPAPSNFCDASFQESRTDARLAQVIKQGKGPMPPFGALFDDTQTALLVGYIRSFQPKNSP